MHRGVPESPAAQMTSAASSVAEDEVSHGSFGVVVGPAARTGNIGLGKKRKLGADDPGLPLHPYTSRQAWQLQPIAASTRNTNMHRGISIQHCCEAIGR